MFASAFRDLSKRQLGWPRTYKEYWTAVFNAKNHGQQKINPALTKVVTTLLSLPFSNTAVKSGFCQFKPLK